MLQNRVDPFGDIIKTAARGALMGNRGVLHNHKQELLRPFRLQAWITCLLEFKQRKRPVMMPGNYTELFFLDEATSFAAGHRPCCECRRADFGRFKAYWLTGNQEFGFDRKTSIQKVDAIIHSERIKPDKSKATYLDSIGNLPSGVFIVQNGNPFLLSGGLAYQWSPFGYDKGIELPSPSEVIVLTPRSVVNAFRAGYEPQMLIAVG